MNDYLLAFSINPVQDYISQSRKTQDFYNSTIFLAALTEQALSKLKQLCRSAEIIYPHKNIKTKPNRFIALIKGQNENELADLGEKVKSSVQTFYERESERVFLSLFGNLPKPAGYGGQIAKHLQIYWAARPVDIYADSYREIGKDLASVKNLRAFPQMEESGRKCSLCGERNALFFNGEINKFPYLGNGALRLADFRILHGEGLCAVCLTKRFFFQEGKNPFPSTAGIACMDWKNRIEEDNEKGKALLDGYKKLFGDEHRRQFFDDQLYYIDSLEDIYLQKSGFSPSGNNLDLLRKKLEAIYKEYGAPPAYYALLFLDGDDMGKWLGGGRLIDGVSLKDFHRELSKRLGLFTDLSGEIISKPGRGKVVYAGGDDCCIFLCLSDFFASIKGLRDSFHTTVSEPLKDKYFRYKDDHITISAGIVIAHYKTPLAEAVKWGREMERKAKKYDGQKDSFGLAVLKHSGEIKYCVIRWDKLDCLSTVYGALYHEVTSDAFINKIDRAFRRIEFDSKYVRVVLTGLIHRSLNLARAEGESQKEFAIRKKEGTVQLVANIEAFYDGFLADGRGKDTATMLHILNFIRRKLKNEDKD